MKKTLTILLAMAVAISAFAGCEKKQTAGNGSITVTTPDSYPIDTDETLTYWMVVSGHVTAVRPSLNETPHAAALMEKTGIKVEYIHPVVGQENESFNLLISSGDLPDIIEYNWKNYYPGGVDKAINDNIILPLDDVFDKVSPNIKKYAQENPEVDKLLKSPAGHYYGYPMLILHDKLLTFRGPMVRQDLLDKAGLDQPETVEDWDNMLRTFKSMGVKTPITLNLSSSVLENMSAILGGFNIGGGMYVDNGVVKYGPYEKAYKDYVTLLTNWYKDGILDKNFADVDTKRVSALVTSGEVGAAFGSAGGDFGTWLPVLEETVPEAKFIPVKYPVSKKGDTPFIGQKNFPVSDTYACISATSKNVELAARFLDYGYTEEGHNLFNFGVEGESYEMIDGKPIYTDNIMDPKKNGGITVGAAMGQYIRANSTGPFEQDPGYLDQFYTNPVQREAVGIWSATDALDHLIPGGILNAEENKQYSKIKSDIDVYKQEFLFKTITGEYSLDKFDEYYETMKKMGIEDAIKLYQNAYDRFMKK